MNEEEIHLPGRAAGTGDAELDAMLAAAEDRLLAAIQCSLDLDAGLAQIIGAPPRSETDPAIPADAASTHGPEDRYLTGPGRIMYRHVIDLQNQAARAAARASQSRAALKQAELMEMSRQYHHRGGDRPWLLRVLIVLAVTAEAVTAYVSLDILAANRPLAVGLSALAALAAGALACILADRRLERLGVPLTARLLEGIFVGVLATLRFESLSDPAQPGSAGGRHRRPGRDHRCTRADRHRRDRHTDPHVRHLSQQAAGVPLPPTSRGHGYTPSQNPGRGRGRGRSDAAALRRFPGNSRSSSRQGPGAGRGAAEGHSGQRRRLPLRWSG